MKGSKRTLTCNTSKLPTTYKANLARVKATFNLFSSERNPIPLLPPTPPFIELLADFDRTHEIMMTSASDP